MIGFRLGFHEYSNEHVLKCIDQLRSISFLKIFWQMNLVSLVRKIFLCNMISWFWEPTVKLLYFIIRLSGTIFLFCGIKGLSLCYKKPVFSQFTCIQPISISSIHLDLSLSINQCPSYFLTNILCFPMCATCHINFSLHNIRWRAYILKLLI